MSSNEATPRWWIQRCSCRARNGLPPHWATSSARAAGSIPSRLGRSMTVGIALTRVLRPDRAGSTAVNVAFREEESDFHGSGFRSVGAMHGIGVDAVGEIGADRAGFSLLRVGCAHQLTILGNGILAFQHLYEHGARHHEVDQILEEGAFFVNGIETLGIGARKLHQARGNDLEAGLLEAGDDLADDVLGDRVGLDDGKGAFNCHVYSVQLAW